MPDIFVSYGRSDRPHAQRIASIFEQRGWSVWWDRKILAGEQFSEAIEREIDQTRCVVVLWSTSSVASNWVRDEATEGTQRNILVPGTDRRGGDPARVPAAPNGRSPRPGLGAEPFGFRRSRGSGRQRSPPLRTQSRTRTAATGGGHSRARQPAHSDPVRNRAALLPIRGAGYRCSAGSGRDVAGAQERHHATIGERAAEHERAWRGSPSGEPGRGSGPDRGGSVAPCSRSRFRWRSERQPRRGSGHRRVG